MKDENLTDLSIDELLVLLAKSQRDYANAKSNKESLEKIQRAKDYLQKVQKAIVDKRENPPWAYP